MLTPSFNITQNDEHLFIKIHAPYTQLKEVEINVLESVFWFYSSPYFLRLHFPCAIVDNDEPPASFDSDKGEFEVQLKKVQAGEVFPDLDLLGTLLAPKRTQQNIKPTIEVVSGLSSENTGDNEAEEEDEDEDEWLFDQILPQNEQVTLLQNSSKYGFGNLTSGVFQQVKSEFKEIIDLPEPDGILASQREELKIKDESNRFCPDHYLADFMEPEVIEEYMSYTPPWCTETTDTVKLSHKEKDCLKKLGNKEFLLSREDKTGVWLSLVDIVFAYAYNHRTTLGENNVESAWTINKLSATLSWFANFSSLHGVTVSCIRRSLTFPLYRNWDLAKLVLKDTISIFKLGRRRVLKCLVEVHSMFAASEPRYLLNQLYINDYCIWLQRASETKLAKFTKALEEITVSKNDIGFDLEELEQAALLVQEEEEFLTEKMNKIQIQSEESSTSSDSDTSSGESTLDSDDDSSPES
ncbi:protein SHQ1 homolog [Macrosteles quadrilineatus]|uniref:protein SHQ1 homolog n=1 Tax=Macrosteles quadrilineatus TaxID=74068 RepID=UPI0023E0DD37|nr:protein SHQ1 homolog [Macrosteles quadrilineatus]